ncbi:T9SS type A sorting domain-containing protein [Crocinitomicaceae bacterium]|nr:T9SS type A sorting domain-containing protein [Crocinitomicaceae bacterium]MDC0257691.1 T9SS type A sorting domain-containing protein [Crocinitomicaceae bacterium]
MKIILFYCCLCLLINNALAQQTINASITHDNMQRDYILYVPASYDGTTAVPLLFNFHGYTSNATQQLVYGDFRPIADTAGFIIVHPQGTLDNTGTTHFNVGFGGSTTDDVGFTSALLDTLISQYEINEERVYSTGMSNGGYMSFHLACNLSDRIASVASVTGAMVPATLNNCGATHTTPILQIHGTNDGTVPYNGGVWSSSIDDVLNHWVTYNGCVSTPVVASVTDLSTTDGSTVERISYTDANGCTLVKHYKITNGGHTWPGSIVNLPGTNYDIDASKEVWDFVSQFDINGLIGNCQPLGLDESLTNPFSLAPNPSNDLLIVNGLSQEFEAQLLNSQGKVILNKTIDPSNNSIDVSELPAGNYVLKLGTQSLKVAVMH